MFYACVCVCVCVSPFNPLSQWLVSDLPSSMPQSPFAMPLVPCMLTDICSRRVTARSSRRIKFSIIVTNLENKRVFSFVILIKSIGPKRSRLNPEEGNVGFTLKHSHSAASCFHNAGPYQQQSQTEYTTKYPEWGGFMNTVSVWAVCHSHNICTNHTIGLEEVETGAGMRGMSESYLKQ